MISIEKIQKLVSSGDKSTLPTFCILKDRQKNLITHEIHTVYSIVTGAPNNRNITDIDRRLAKKIIELFGLCAYNESKNGAVYDTPEQEYRNKYRHFQVAVD